MSAPEEQGPPGTQLPVSPEAWGGAVRFKTPSSSLREAMEQQAQLRANTPGLHAQQQQQLDGTPHGLSNTLDAQGWMQEALQARRDALTGQLRCQLCAKVVPDHRILAQHLKDKHGSPAAEENSTPLSYSISLADLLRKQSTRSEASRTPSSAPQLTAKQMRSMKGLVQAYPTKRALAEAFKGRLFAAGKKKMSRLKRIILRERAEKAFADATAAADSATAAARVAAALRDDIREQLRTAGEVLMSELRGGGAPDASAMTQLQVLEVAAVEAERRLLDADRKTKEAEAELAKASAERARVCNDLMGGDEEQPQSLQEAATGIQEAVAAAAKAAAAPDAAERSSVPGGEPEEPPHSAPVPPQGGTVEWAVGQMAHRAGEEPEESGRMQEHGKRKMADLGVQSTDDDEESIDGLDDFEDVLATWLHAAHEQVLGGHFWGPAADREGVAAASLAAAAAAESGTQSGQAAPDEDPEAKQGQVPAAAEVRTPRVSAPSMGTQAPPAGAAMLAQYDVQRRADLKEEEEGEDEGDADLAPDDWDDILSAWMNAVGLTEMLGAAGKLPEGGADQSPPLPPASQGAVATQPPPQPPLSALGDRVSALYKREAQPPASAPPLQPSQEQRDALAVLMARGNPAGGHRNGAGRPFVAVVPELDLALSSTLPLLGHETPHGGAQPATSTAAAMAAMQSGSGGEGRRAARAPRLMRDVPAWLDAADSDDKGDDEKGEDDNESSVDSETSAALRATSTFAAANSALDLAARMASSLKGQPASVAVPGALDRRLPSSGGSCAQAKAGGPVGANEPAANAAAAAAEQVGPPDLMRKPPLPVAPGSTPMMVSTMEARWRSKLQGQSFSVEEMIERGMIGGEASVGGNNDSPASSYHAYSGSPRRALDTGEQSASSSALQHLEGASVFLSLPFSASLMPSSRALQTEQARLLQGLQADSSTDAARQRALESILKKHEAPLQALGGPGLSPLGQPLQQVGGSAAAAFQDASLGARLHSHGLLQAYQQGPLSLDPFPLPGLSGPNSLPSMPGEFSAMQFAGHQMPQKRSGWGPGAMPEEEPSSFGSHEFTCEVCGITCCGLVNFEQHCSSKKHLRRAAAAAGAMACGGVASDSTDNERNTTYVGLQAQCRNYCKQVISTELNRAVVELLQQLLFWQERSKAAAPYNVAKRKRLVSGLREVAKAVRLRKACTVVVAPNIEQIESEGGLDDLLSSILTQAEAASIPIVFALSRKKLGQMFGCRKKMSAIAILDYSGAEAIYHHMESLAQQGRIAWLAHNAGAADGGGPATLLQQQPLSSDAASPASELSSQQHQSSEEGGMFRRHPSAADTPGLADFARSRSALLGAQQLLSPAGGSPPAGAAGGYQPQPQLHHPGQQQPQRQLPRRFGARPPPQNTMSAAQRQAQQQHFQQMGRLASMQSAQELLDSHMAGLYDQQALAQQLGAGLHLDAGAGGAGGASGFNALDAAGSFGGGVPGLDMSGLDFGQPGGVGALDQLGGLGTFPGQMHWLEAGGYGEALYGQAFGGQQHQLPFGVEDPRVHAQGGHYMQQGPPGWQNPGGPQGGGGSSGGNSPWFS